MSDSAKYVHKPVFKQSFLVFSADFDSMACQFTDPESNVMAGAGVERGD